MKQESQDNQRRRAIPRFGVGVLLALTACVASYITGRKQGFEHARDMWAGLPGVARTYDVHDLISKKTSTEPGMSGAELCKLLQTELLQTGIAKTSTDYQVNTGSMSGMLVISANDIAHRKTADILARLRAAKDD